MKLNISYKRLEASSAEGDAIELKLTYTSFIKSEIDAMQDLFRQAFKAGTVIDTLTTTVNIDDLTGGEE